jgi:hypothetical protein
LLSHSKNRPLLPVQTTPCPIHGGKARRHSGLVQRLFEGGGLIMFDDSVDKKAASCTLANR